MILSWVKDDRSFKRGHGERRRPAGTLDAPVSCDQDNGTGRVPEVCDGQPELLGLLLRQRSGWIRKLVEQVLNLDICGGASKNRTYDLSIISSCQGREVDDPPRSITL